MKPTLKERASKVPTTVAHVLFGLVREMAPVVLFFFVAFGLIGLLYKLFVSQYSIEFSAFSKAAVAALILGKVVLLLDWAQPGRGLERYRRIVVVVCKTIIYALAVIIVGLGERIVHSMREAGSLQSGISALIANANVDRFLGFVLLISLIVGAYLTVQEIDRAMGKGALFRLFFEPPSDKAKSQ
jgi:hypothetical protein